VRLIIKQFEIYFSNLNEDTQKELLAFYGMESEDDGNFDNLAIAILDYEPDSKNREVWQI